MKNFKKFGIFTSLFVLVPLLAFGLFRPFVNNTIIVTAAGATDRTQGPDIKVSSCTFQAPSTNAGSVYAGGSTVTNAAGTNIGLAIAANGSFSNSDMENLNWIYFAADNANDEIRYFCN